MTIHELLALTGLTVNDEIPVWDAEASGEPTKKISAQNLAAAVKTLASLLGTSDVVNNLTSTATDKPLSANMGKALDNARTWTYLGQLQTVNETLSMSAGIVEILFVHYNTNAGTAFSSLLIPNVSMPLAFAVYSSAGEAIISRSRATLTLTSNTNNSIVKVYYR